MVLFLDFQQFLKRGTIFFGLKYNGITINRLEKSNFFPCHALNKLFYFVYPVLASSIRFAA